MLEYRHGHRVRLIELVPDGPVARLGQGIARVAGADGTMVYGAPRATLGGSLPGVLLYAGLGILAALTGAAARRSPFPLVAGLGVVTIAALVAHLVCLRCADHVATRRIVLHGRGSMATFVNAADLANRTMLVWPSVAGLDDRAYPRSLLEAALWDLGQRLSLRELTLDRLTVLRRTSLDTAATIYSTAGTDEQRHRLASLAEEQQRDIADRVSQLQRLAAACERGWRGAGTDQQNFDPAADSATAVAIAELATQVEYVQDAYAELLDLVPAAQALPAGSIPP